MTVVFSPWSSQRFAADSLRALSRITSQSWGSDLRQIWPRTIERNRESSQVYAEDFAIEERLKMG